MKNITTLLYLFFLFGNAVAQNQPPIINNLTAAVDYSNNTITLSFDLEDNENNDVEISLQVSDNDGQTYTVNTSSSTGDVGYPITPSTSKQIVWTAPDLANNYQIRLIADDLQTIDIQQLVGQVDTDRLWNDLSFMEGIRHRNASNNLLQDTRDLLTQTFQDNNLTTYTHEFDYNGYTGQNVIGDLHGMKEKELVYILDGHYDTVDNSPGADDNATAVAGVLEAVRILSKYSFEKTIRFIGFDLEEDGLVGSSRYVTAAIPNYETVEGVFNLEMIGYYDDAPYTQIFPTGFDLLFPEANAALEADSFRGNFITNISLEPNTSIGDAFHAASNTYVPELKIIDLKNPTGFLIPDLLRSDHAPFWGASIPAVMLTDGSEFRNPNYHTAADVKENLDQVFLTNVVKATVATLAQEAVVRNATSATVDILSSTSELDCSFSISPNPSDEFVKLSFGKCLVGKLDIQLYDVSGFLILEKNISPNNNNFTTINTRPLSAGIYFLKIGNEQGFSMKKIMVF